MSDPLPLARDVVAHFRANLSTVCLRTASADGLPEASAAATILDDNGAFVIFVSGLAAHTRNLRENPRASVLLAEPESAATNALAMPLAYVEPNSALRWRRATDGATEYV